MSERFDAGPVLARLKDFQRRTVDYVFRRFYLDDPPARRFLVADEVGLGKTMVARGLIARALEHLHDQTDRIDVVYVCSNAAIAAQNINRLNVTQKNEFALATRLTLLPSQVSDLAANAVNFVSFTPGTTFDLKSGGGLMRERAILYRILREEEWLDRSGLMNLLQGWAGRPGWLQAATKWNIPIDDGLADAYRASVREDAALRTEVQEHTARFHRYREHLSRDDSRAREKVVGDLRLRLAKTCLDALEPDLVILDEFQRFRDLLDGSDEAAELARALFDFKGVRVLLLSATPYKMLALDHEQDDDHYPEFLRTLGFLLGDEVEVQLTRKEIQDFRRKLLDLGGEDGATDARKAIESRLLRVMCRTERVAMTRRRDAMVAEPPRPSPLCPSDLAHVAIADAAARAVGACDIVEYWKSSPYLLSFLKHYELRRKLDGAACPLPEALTAELARRSDHLLSHDQFDCYDAVDPANARLRSLLSDTIDRGLWQLLWMPPSLPYSQPSGACAGVGDVTKALVFSAWHAVPDAIASLVSYDAERRMVQDYRAGLRHSSLHDEIRPLLRFTRGRDGRLTGMPVLTLLYPSPSLSTIIDPLKIAAMVGGPLTREQLLREAERLTSQRLAELGIGPGAGSGDQRWYWAALALMDAKFFPRTREWLTAANGWRHTASGQDEESGTGFADHVEHFAEAFDGTITPPLGTPPADLVTVLAELAVAAPGVCASRALRRIAPNLEHDDPRILTDAARIATGFRTLFNLPETIALLRGSSDESYWRLVLGHGLDGNLQALLDEQVHVLQESLGVLDADPTAKAKAVSEAIAGSLALRTAPLQVDDVRMAEDHSRLEIKTFNSRCRFALRFGELRDDAGKTLARVDAVRHAFNSPFRPFVLASTSIGQEGLDFHIWCHAVTHWNLPSNPVDLEQREGRVHRYKGHAVRKNIAKRYGLAALRNDWDGVGDPWQHLFTKAAEDRPADMSDLVPYWVFEIEDGACIERRVPVLPFSTELGKLRRLKKTLALYRVVFGQPRQQDLLMHLSDRLTADEAESASDAWRISLLPP